jgi:hypothetical protein
MDSNANPNLPCNPTFLEIGILTVFLYFRDSFRVSFELSMIFLLCAKVLRRSRSPSSI